MIMYDNITVGGIELKQWLGRSRVLNWQNVMSVYVVMHIIVFSVMDPYCHDVNALRTLRRTKVWT